MLMIITNSNNASRGNNVPSFNIYSDVPYQIPSVAPFQNEQIKNVNAPRGDGFWESDIYN